MSTANNNQIVKTSSSTLNWAYDAAGDVTNDTTNQYIYDGEGRVCAVHSLISGAIYGYVYDGNGDRIAKGTITTWSCNLSSNGFAIQNAYVVGQAGEQLSEMGGTQNWLHMNVFAGGKLVATYGGGTTYFALSDWLGTKRVETVPNGTCLSTYASLAYGDELTPNGTCPDATEHHYTTKEHDGESGNDFFLARYYSSTAGRFISPDWASGAEAVPYATFGDPQSLNLYEYVGNDPLSRFDTDGHGCPPDCPLSGWDRLTMFVTGFVDANDGQAKLAAAWAAGASSPVTNLAGAAGAAYLGISGTGQTMAGYAEMFGSVMPSNIAKGSQETADITISATTVLGLATLAKTGNPKAGAAAAAVESLGSKTVAGTLVEELKGTLVDIHTLLDFSHGENRQQQQKQNVNQLNNESQPQKKDIQNCMQLSSCGGLDKQQMH